MRTFKKRYLVAIVIIIVSLAGYLVPLGAYTSRYGCDETPIPTRHLHLILGETLEAARDEDNAQRLRFDIGCSLNMRFVQYLL